MISIRCVHIQPVLDHQQLGALDGAASAGAVQSGLPQAVQGGHLGSSLDQGCCTPETELLLVFKVKFETKTYHADEVRQAT